MSDVACDLRVLSSDERASHLALTSTLFADATVEDTGAEIFVRLANRPGVVREAGAFIENERRCCSFFRFELRVDAQSVALCFEGPAEARAAVNAALELAREHQGEKLLHAVTDKTGFSFHLK
ncbi:MAG: hypothetical protein JNM17_17590 [Archangium sp.]|nr:hypothetical protein [Archangium sp.]